MYSHRNTTRSHSSLVHVREFWILSDKHSTRHLFTTWYSCICLVFSPFHFYIVRCAASSEHITFITSNSSVVWIRRRFLELFHQTAWLWSRWRLQTIFSFKSLLLHHAFVCPTTWRRWENNNAKWWEWEGEAGIWERKKWEIIKFIEFPRLCVVLIEKDKMNKTNKNISCFLALVLPENKITFGSQSVSQSCYRAWVGDYASLTMIKVFRHMPRSSNNNRFMYCMSSFVRLNCLPLSICNCSTFIYRNSLTIRARVFFIISSDIAPVF